LDGGSLRLGCTTAHRIFRPQFSRR
jgi:hypothetical protein